MKVSYEKAGKRLKVRQTPPVYVLVLGSATVAFLLTLFLIDWFRAASPSVLGGLVVLAFLTTFALQLYMPSHLIIDADSDRLDTRLWRFLRYDTYRRRGLRNATAIRVHIDSAGDSAIIKKYMVFSDNTEIEIPSADTIENVVWDWYQRSLGIELAITGDKFKDGLLQRYVKWRDDGRK